MRKTIIPYKHELTQKARELRKNATFSERLLWKYLKNKKFMGYGFYRQKPIDKYIVDFFCYELMLAIEVDGITHDSKFNYDQKRQKDIEKLEVTIIRFNALDVVNKTQDVLWTLEEWVVAHTNQPSPSPSEEGDSGVSLPLSRGE